MHHRPPAKEGIVCEKATHVAGEFEATGAFPGQPHTPGQTREIEDARPMNARLFIRIRKAEKKRAGARRVLCFDAFAGIRTRDPPFGVNSSGFVKIHSDIILFGIRAHTGRTFLTGERRDSRSERRARIFSGLECVSLPLVVRERLRFSAATGAALPDPSPAGGIFFVLTEKNPKKNGPLWVAVFLFF